MREYFKPITKNDITASAVDRENADTIALTFNVWLTLLTDSPDLSSISHTDLKSGIAWWRKLFLAVPYKELVKCLDVFSHTLQKEMQWVNGKPSIGSFLPGLAKLPLIGKVYLEWYKTSIGEDGSFSDPKQRLRFLVTFLKLGKKAVLVDPSLEDNALREVLTDEKDLGALRFPERLIEHLSMVFRALFPRFVDESLHLKHGNGFVAEGINSVYDKIASTNLVSTKMLRQYYFRNADWMASRGAYGYGLAALRSAMSNALFVPDWSLITEGNVVAKDANNVRFIGHEPASKMILQQAVFKMWDETFRQTYVSESIDLSDQTRSKVATLVASANSLSSTIDLSRASNRLAWDLIRKIVPESILQHLDAARTQNLRVGDNVVNLKMASTMGSANTFPLQTAVFYAVTVLAYLYHSALVRKQHPNKRADRIPQMTCASDAPWDEVGFENTLTIHTHQSLGNWLKTFTITSKRNRGRHYDIPLVYGDDIICATQCVDILVLLLETLGLVVNTNKSFTKTDAVRESCGMFAVFGVDFTPELLKTPQFVGDMTIETMYSLIGFANRLAKAAIFKNTRELVVRLVLRGSFHGNIPKWRGVNAVLFTYDDSDSSRLFTTTPDINWHLQKRLYSDMEPAYRDSRDNDFQLDEVRGFSVKPIYNDDFVSPPVDGQPMPKRLDRRVLKRMKHFRLDIVDGYRYAQAGRKAKSELADLLPLVRSTYSRGNASWRTVAYNEWRKNGAGATRAWKHALETAGSLAKIDYRRPSSYAIDAGWTPHRLA